VTNARGGEQIALRASERLPAPDPHRRNLLDLDLVSAAKLFPLEHPESELEALAQLRTRLAAMIKTFKISGATRRAGSRLGSKPRTKRSGKKRR